jgi:hypothetical protein
MATDRRIYLAAPKTQASNEPEARRLIRARHPAGVARHLANEWHIVTPSQDELIDLTGKGVKVEEARDEYGDNPSTN